MALLLACSRSARRRAATTRTRSGGGGGDASRRRRSSSPPGRRWRKIQEAGEITIGVKYDVPPFGFKNPQNNEIEGFDVDLGKPIAEELGVKPKFIEAISDNRIPFLQDGTADLILSTMTINAERDRRSTSPSRTTSPRGGSSSRTTRTIKGVDDLAGKKVCTALGSTYEETLKKQAPKADLRLVDSYSECLELIQNGAVDAVSTDDVILTGMIIQDDTLKLVGDELTTEPYGAGIKDGDTEIRSSSTTWSPSGSRRRLGGGLREVGRPVHERGAGAADDDARRGDRATG